METEYLKIVNAQFMKYKMMGEKTFAQLPDNELFWQYNAEMNSVGTIVKHLCGNMRSRWTDFLTTDGEKEWRTRDAEFENDIQNRDEMMATWNRGWECVFNTLKTLAPSDLNKTVHIGGIAHSATEAINQNLAHYVYHIGQIVFIGKMRCGENWVSLSIPKKK